MKKYFTAFVSLAITASMLFTTFVGASDISIDVESNDVRIIQLNKNVERVILGNTIMDEEITQTGRTITTTGSDGQSIYYEDFSTGIATLSVNGQVVETYDTNVLRAENNVWIMSQEDQEIFQEYFSDASNYFAGELPEELSDKYTVTYAGNGMVIEPLNMQSSSAAVVKAYDDVEDAYPPYTQKQVSSKSVYSSVCGRNLSMKVKDSMYNYVSVSQNKKLFMTGTAISTIYASTKIANSVLMTSLGGYITMVSGIYKLLSDVQYYTSEEYTFYAMRQGYVYDYTNYNRDVSVISETGAGKLSMTWDFINGEYTNPEWKITAQAYPHTISYSTIYSNAQEIWENNIEEYGYWKWGDI